jgi:hypothetical protein
MNGLQHYEEAERLLELAKSAGLPDLAVAAAQVHATLALAEYTRVHTNDAWRSE